MIVLFAKGFAALAVAAFLSMAFSPLFVESLRDIRRRS